MPAQDRREDGSPDSRPAPPAWSPRSATPARKPSPPPGGSVPRRCREDGAATPNFSPPTSPSLNLPPLDTSPYSSPAELRRPRQQSSPPSHSMDPSSPSPLPVIRGPESRHEGDAAARGHSSSSSRNVLARRLNDLATKIHREGQQQHEEGGGGDETLGTLNAMLDQMESVLSHHAQHPDARSAALRHLGADRANGDSGDAAPKKPPLMSARSLSDWLGPLSPLEASALTVDLHEEEEDGDVGSQLRLDHDHDHVDHHPLHRHHHHHCRSKMTHEQAERVVAEAQNLCREMDAVMASLKARQEESEASSIRPRPPSPSSLFIYFARP